MLGKLAKWLRILGFDTRCEPLEGREPVAAYRTRGFFLLTRRAKLCGQAGVFFLKANDPWEQLREVVSLTSITPQEVRLLRRCLLCNDQLREMGREEAFGNVPEYVFETQTSFQRCSQCRKIYWAGSHPERIRQRLERELGWKVGSEE